MKSLELAVKNPEVHFTCSQIFQESVKIGLIEKHDSLPLEKQSSPANIFQMFALYEHQIAVLDRKSFGKIGADGKHFLRISIAAEQSVLEKGISRLKNAGEDLSGLDRFLKERPDLTSA